MFRSQKINRTGSLSNHFFRFYCRDRRSKFLCVPTTERKSWRAIIYWKRNETKDWADQQPTCCWTSSRVAADKSVKLKTYQKTEPQNIDTEKKKNSLTFCCSPFVLFVWNSRQFFVFWQKGQRDTGRGYWRPTLTSPSLLSLLPRSTTNWVEAHSLSLPLSVTHPFCVKQNRRQRRLLKQEESHLLVIVTPWMTLLAKWKEMWTRK